MGKVSYYEIFDTCLSSFIDKKTQQSYEGIPLKAKTDDIDYKNAVSVALENHYTPINDEPDSGSTVTFHSHYGKAELERALFENNQKDIAVNSTSLSNHWFMEDMARNWIVQMNRFSDSLEENSQVLIIEDNLQGVLKKRYRAVVQLLSYKVFKNEDKIEALCIDKSIEEFYRYLGHSDGDNHACQITCLKKSEPEGCSLDLKKVRYILVDLMIEGKNLGLEIIKALAEKQSVHPGKYNYEIIAVSRSTNTEDIQKALNFGASLYILKERLFSLPYRLNELGWQAPSNAGIYDSFRSLLKLPTHTIRRLRNEKISLYNKDDYNWVKKLPKAELHYHFGGGMDAHTTLKLSLITLIQYLFRFHQFGSLDKGFVNEDIAEIFTVAHNKDFCSGNTKLEELIGVVHSYSESYKEKVAEQLQGLSFYKPPTLKGIQINASAKKITSMFALRLQRLSMYKLSTTKRVHINASLKKITSPEKFYKTVSGKYEKELYGIKPFFVTCLFNICLEFDVKTLGSLIEFLRELVPGEITSYNEESILGAFNRFISENEKKKNNCLTLSKLIQATHGNKLEDAVGGISLASFLKGCDYTGGDVAQTALALRVAVQDMCLKAMQDNVIYLSVRMTPMNFTRGGLSGAEVWQAIKEAYHWFLDKYRDYKLILTIIIALKRHYEDKELTGNVNFGIKYKAAMPDEPFNMTSEQIKKIFPCVVGFDLTGLETEFKPIEFRTKFKDVFAECMPVTIHAGEETPAKYIWEASYELNSDRVGHGLSLVDDPKLMNRFKDFNKCIELCPSSNYLTQEGFLFRKGNKILFCSSEREKPKGKPYPSAVFLENDVSFVVCTDDPAIQNTDLTTEYLWLSEMTVAIKNRKPEWRGISKWETPILIRNGFKYCFLPRSVKKGVLAYADNEVYHTLEKP